MKINTNAQIINKIHSYAKLRGLANDAQITRAAGVSPVMFIDMKSLKTSPRLDTIDKFAQALGCEVIDLIYEAPPKRTVIKEVRQVPLPTDKKRFLSILDTVNNTLSELGLVLSEHKKFELVMRFYDAGFGKSDDKSAPRAANDEIGRALKLVINK